MRKREIQRLQKELIATRQALVADVRALMESNLRSRVSGGAHDRSAKPNHPAELANRSYEMELGVEALQQKEAIIRSVDQALARIQDGAFGSCARCGTELSLERLRALPHARLCLGCQEGTESGRFVL